MKFAIMSNNGVDFAPSKPIIRKFSLQQPASHRHLLVRRQRSTGDERAIQIFDNPTIHGKKRSSGKTKSDKPKIRVAWGERIATKPDNINQVEVIARQIPGKPKSSNGKITLGRPSTGTNSGRATILYSRQELAERLRLAWKHREENRANIDIFLAHNTVEERCDSGLSHRTNITAPSTPLPRNNISRFDEKNDLSLNSKKKEQDCNLEDLAHSYSNFDGAIDKGTGGINISISKDRQNDCQSLCLSMKDSRESIEIDKSLDVEIKGKNDPFMGCEVYDVENIDQRLKIEETMGTEKEDKLDITKPEESPEDNEKSLRGIDNYSCLDNNNSLPRIESRENQTTKYHCSSAKQKRASFRSGNNKAFSRPVVDEKTLMNSRNNSMEMKFDRKTRRTNSAPPQRQLGVSNAIRTQVNIVIDVPTTVPRRNSAKAIDEMTAKSTRRILAENNESKASSKPLVGRSVRSAPLKRRSKSAKRRMLTSNSFSKDNNEDRDKVGPSNKNVNNRNKLIDSKTMDIITMVSLVSSADSDSDGENSPSDDTLINELRNKLPTTPIIKTPVNPFVNAARKPVKSVSFQQDSSEDEYSPRKETHYNNQETNLVKDEVFKKNPLERFMLVPKHGIGYNLSFEQEHDINSTINWRTEIASPLLPMLTLINDDDDNTPDAPLTDREKRCLAVPIGDLHDKKRKLLKTRSTTISSRTEMEGQLTFATGESTNCEERFQVKKSTESDQMPTQQKSILIFDNSKANTSVTSPARGIKDQEINEPLSEPNFHTIKEKECWHLYRRMCDKGVCVSFDTVLRGMLTPTEYRLRQKAMTQDI